MEKTISFRAFVQLGETSNVPLFAYFWAPWAAPCKYVEPVFEQLAKDMKERLLFFRINIDEDCDFGIVFRFPGVPSFLLFHKGEVLWKRTGILSYDAIKREVENNLPR